MTLPAFRQHHYAGTWIHAAVFNKAAFSHAYRTTQSLWQANSPLTCLDQFYWVTDHGMKAKGAVPSEFRRAYYNTWFHPDTPHLFSLDTCEVIASYLGPKPKVAEAFLQNILLYLHPIEAFCKLEPTQAEIIPDATAQTQIYLRGDPRWRKHVLSFSIWLNLLRHLMARAYKSPQDWEEDLFVNSYFKQSVHHVPIVERPAYRQTVLNFFPQILAHTPQHWGGGPTDHNHAWAGGVSCAFWRQPTSAAAACNALTRFVHSEFYHV